MAYVSITGETLSNAEEIELDKIKSLFTLGDNSIPYAPSLGSAKVIKGVTQSEIEAGIRNITSEVLSKVSSDYQIESIDVRSKSIVLRKGDKRITLAL